MSHYQMPSSVLFGRAKGGKNTGVSKDQQLAINRVAYSSKPMLCLANTVNADANQLIKQLKDKSNG